MVQKASAEQSNAPDAAPEGAPAAPAAEPRRRRVRGQAPTIQAADPSAVEDARRAILAAVVAGPPEPLRSQWVEELVRLVVASRQLLSSFEGGSVLTQRGGTRPRYRTYESLQARVERLYVLLRHDAAPGKRPRVDPQKHLEELRRRHATAIDRAEGQTPVSPLAQS